jgi:uncharacterized repeat protein (TIGR04138 family)
MARDVDFWDAVRRIREKDTRFEPEAYPFVMEALEYTLVRIGERRHVSARELLDGLCLYSRERFGLLAADVLKTWGIRGAYDVGLAVFQLIGEGVLAKQPNDALDDFAVDYDLRDTLEREYFE